MNTENDIFKVESNFEKQKSKIKNLKINFIDIKDFKNIENINTALYDWNVIWWYNWNWKSSFVEAILTAIQGQKFFGQGSVSPASLVKKWENKAVIKLSIEWEEVELKLTREFSKWTAKNPAWKTKLIAELNWKKISQKDLDSLLNSLTLDPLKLWQLTISEQIKEIKETVKLDTSEIDKEIKEVENQRKELRTLKIYKNNLFEEFAKNYKPVKKEKKSIKDLLEKKELLQKKNETVVKFKQKQEEIEELKRKLVQAEKELEEIKQEWKDLVDKIKKENIWTLEEINKEIENIEEYNKEVEKYDEYLKIKKERDEAEKEFNEIEEKLKELRKKRTEIIANSDLPDYMEISDELWILVDWIEYKLLNTARKIEVAIDLILISGSPLRMIRIEQGWELDIKTLEKIKNKILDNNFQIFIERPIIDKFDSIVIDEWNLTLPTNK